jgi:dihydroorotase
MSTQAPLNHITLTRPDDWHLHVRDGDALRTVVPHTAAQFGRAIIMPNLRPPVTTAAQALAYAERIRAAVPEGVAFEPLMTLYLTDNLPADEIARAQDAGVVAAKLYPAGATTNSDAGVTDIRKTYKTLEAMQRAGLLLLVHGEVTSPDIDLFDREAVFIDQHMIPLRRDFPELKVVFEHITTKEAAQYVREAGPFTAATLTAHHLLYNRNAIFTGGIRPHYYCLPVLKRETHRQALLAAAASGSDRFFLGTDSAPHPAHLKEHATGCAGSYTAHAAMELYAEAFDSVNALDKLEAFASYNGPAFYGLPRNTGTITLQRESWTPPESFAFGEAQLKPLRSGEALPWRLFVYEVIGANKEIRAECRDDSKRASCCTVCRCRQLGADCRHPSD